MDPSTISEKDTPLDTCEGGTGKFMASIPHNIKFNISVKVTELM
jgi:hypothetical protein